MKNFGLWPYEECEFDLDKGTKEFKIKTPWQTVTFEVEPKKLFQFEQLLSALSSAPTQDSLEFITKALKPLSGYRLFYFLPRHLKEDAVLKTEKVLPSNSQHGWDHEPALQLSLVSPGIHDAISLITVLRRYHLLDLLEKVADQPVLKLIADSKDAEKSKKALALMVRQNHFVTESCESMVAPATDRHPQCKDKITAFIAAEKGHDKILVHALKSMGVDPKTEKVLASTSALTDFFKKQAEEDILSFAFLVDVFERSSSGEHPLARVLREKGFDQAAKAIQNHANINIEEEHHNEGLEILEHVGGISEARAHRLVDQAYLATQLVVAMFEERYKEVEKILA